MKFRDRTRKICMSERRSEFENYDNTAGITRRDIICAHPWWKQPSRRRFIGSGFILEGRCTEVLARAVKADVGRKTVQLSFTGCRMFSDGELEQLMDSLPADLRVLRLDLGFSSLRTLDMFAVHWKALVQLELRLTGSSYIRSVGGLGVALRKMENLVYLELWCCGKFIMICLTLCLVVWELFCWR